jgi:hypothetical protein
LATIRWLGRLARLASTNQYSSKGFCGCFMLEGVEHFMLSSTTLQAHMYAHSKKKK